MEIEIPELNGYSPISVTIDDDNVQYEYNQETRLLNIYKNAEVDSEGIITKSLSRSSIYSVTVEYPIQAYTDQGTDTMFLSIPVKGYSYGYNNPNSEFTNPYESKDENIIKLTITRPPTGDIWNINVGIGKFTYYKNDFYTYVVSKEQPDNIYAGNEINNSIDEYEVRWNMVIGQAVADKVILEEPTTEEIINSDMFTKKDGSEDSMYDYIQVTGIRIEGAETVLGNDGFINIYDAESNEKILTLNNSNWNDKKTLEDAKSIRVETSRTISTGNINIYLTKRINDEILTQDYSEEEFEKLVYISTRLQGKIYIGEDKDIITRSAIARYVSTYSNANLYIYPSTIDNQSTSNINISINATSNSFIEKEWKNGTFIVELPEEFINFKINEVSSSNSNVTIKNHVLYKENGKYLIKINTSNEEEDLYTITINADATPNPLHASSSPEINLYAYNENENRYIAESNDIYDMDNDGLTTDRIGYKNKYINIIGTTGLLTTEYITEYDDENNITIAPNIAEVKDDETNREATINISLTNNYTGTISDLVVLGNIPYRDNKFILNGRGLGSTYDTSMVQAITIPEEIREYVIVYYTENETADKDLNNSQNGWKNEEEVTNWSSIRRYLIDFNDYALPVTKNYLFSYKVAIPKDTNYEDVAFSNHAVYFSLDTEEGKYATRTEPNKVGLQVVKKYDMQLQKTKKAYENMLISGAEFALEYLTANNEQLAMIKRTNETGKIDFTGLNVGREYTLKELYVNDDYVLPEEEIKFVSELDENDNLIINVAEGNFDGEIEIVGGETPLVKAKIENESKYTLKIDKTSSLGEELKDVKFSVTGKNANKIYRTNENGNIVLVGLYPDIEYTIQETSATGYYKDNTERKFSIHRNDSNELVILTEDELLKDATIEEYNENPQAIVEIGFINEKIPTYNLEIIKVAADYLESNVEDLERLPGAEFSIESDDDKTTMFYTTDEEGKIIANNLLQYSEGKDVTGKYIIKEISAPSGYANDPEEIELAVRKDNDNVLVADIENKDLLQTLCAVKTSEDTVTLIIQDKPLFKLTKIDDDTGEPLANVKFSIYELDEEGNIIDFAKDGSGEYVGTQDETGKYYVETDENGVIILPLKVGTYKAVELNTPEGYIDLHNEETFRVEGIKAHEEPVYEETEFESAEFEEETKDETNYSVLEINSIEDLVNLSNSVNSGNHYNNYRIELKKTLDFNEDESYEDSTRTDYGDINGNDIIEELKVELTTGKGFKPIGIGSSYYIQTASFEGNNNEIRNLYINRDDIYGNSGLFGYVVDFEIRNLTVSGSINHTFSGYTYVGGIVGYAVGNKCVLKNCTNSTNIRIINTNTRYTNVYVGGIVGYAYKCDLINCTNNGGFETESTATLYTYLGGIVGYSSNLIRIKNCTNEANLETGYYDGGILGYSTESVIINNCTNNGNIVKGENSMIYDAGGIIGYGTYSNNFNDVKIVIDHCTNNGNIIGEISYAGGLISAANHITITNSNNYGDVLISKGYYTGGILGIINNSESVLKCKKVNNYGKISANSGYVSGIIGYAGKYTHIYECNNSGEIICDRENNYAYVGGIVGYSYGNNNYNNTVHNEYIHLYKCNQESDITINVGNTSYIGGLLGNSGGFADIISCNMNGQFHFEIAEGNTFGGYVGGLVGYISAANMRNCCNYSDMIVPSFGGNNFYLGGLIGSASRYYNNEEESTIQNCYNYGRIDMNGKEYCYVGGLFGYISIYRSNFIDCINYKDIKIRTQGTPYVGGLIGESYVNNRLVLKNLYNYGNLDIVNMYSAGYMAGIAGYTSTSEVENCHNYGNIDVETTGGSSFAYTGGIIGYGGYGNYGSIQRCSNIGNIHGEYGYTNYTGGIAGNTGAYTAYCTNKGDVYGTITSAYWKNIEIGGIIRKLFRNYRKLL